MGTRRTSVSRWRAGVVAALVAGSLFASPGVVAGAAGRHGAPEVIASYSDEIAVEGIAVGTDGTVYVSTLTGGEVWRLEAGGGHTTLGRYQTGEAFGVLGLYRYDPTHLLVAVSGSPGSACNGVYLLDIAAGPGAGPCSGALVPGTGAMGLPNAVTVDSAGRIYATDSAAGAVWRAAGPSAPASVWISDPLLAGTGELVGAPLGANGIDVRGRTVYVAVTEGGRVVAVPIGRNGAAGNPSVVSDDPALAGIDGLVVGPDRQLYAVINQQNTLVRISLGGSVTVLATPDQGLEYPGSLTFGPSGGGRGHGRPRPAVYLTNMSIGELFGLDPVFGPSVMRLDVAGAS
ncbi:MAG: SMP-30/gluconolactonase/LRE family protein [Acidimicrobiales bacterium]